MTNKKIISYKRFNPNFFHLRYHMKNPDIRYIFLYGGSSSSKSYSVSQAITLDCLENGNNTLIFRKVGSTIKNSIYEDFKIVIRTLKFDDCFEQQQNTIKCFNGSKIDFSGLDDSEKIKGISNYKRVILEEISEFEEVDFKQIRKRLRGKKGQQIICMFNPISENHWIKKNIFDKEELTEIDKYLYGKLKDPITKKVLPQKYSEVSAKWINKPRNVLNPRTEKYEVHPSDMIVIRSTYLNNFWVVGSPDGDYGYYDRQVIADFEKDKERDYDYYRIYALGEWGSVRTGGEFLPSFDPNKHRKKTTYNTSLPIHITIDNNVLPYISIGLWQINNKEIKEAKQIHEISAGEPFNSVSKASELVVKYLESIHHTEKIFLYGDQTTKSNNTIDDEKRSFFDKFKEGLEKKFIVEDRVPIKNPSVSMSGEFVNSIFSGEFKSIQIEIDESCRNSINDYLCVKKDVNGGILKKRKVDKLTGQSYEEFGHFTDTLRYFITEAFKDEYIKFSLKRKYNKNKEEDMKYYDVNKVDLSNCKTHVEINPNINGKFIAVFSKEKEGRLYIYDVIFSEKILPVSSVCSKIDDKKANVQIECDKSFFSYLKEMRNYLEYVRGRPIMTNSQSIMDAHIDFIHENVYFRNDYDNYPEYVLFIDNLLSYQDNSNIEAMNSLSKLVERIKRLQK